jgi:hypothetical protein
VFHQRHQHGIENAGLGARWPASGDCEVRHLGEAELADQIVDEIRAAHGDGVSTVSAEACRWFVGCCHVSRPFASTRVPEGELPLQGARSYKRKLRG